MNVEINECKRNNTCYDCDDPKCWHRGKKVADCPYYVCPIPGTDCETNCQLIDEYIAEERKMYLEEQNDNT